MPSDRADEPASPSGDRPLIFVSDASAEADQLSVSLRREGYAVVDVALSMLAARVASQRPALILCDVDAEGALEALRALRRIPSGATIDVVVIGAPGGTLERLSEQVSAEASASFARPVDIDQLTRKIGRLVGPGTSAAPPSAQMPSHRPPILGPSSRPPGQRRTDAPRLPSDIPAEPEPDDFVELERGEPPPSIPDVGPRASRPPASHLELSPEIVTLLIEAEHRMSAEQRQLSLDSAQDDATNERHLDPETDAGQLPRDVLEALDEPLEDERPSLMPFEPSVGDGGFGTQAGTATGFDGGTAAGTDALGGREAETGAGPGTDSGPGGAEQGTAAGGSGMSGEAGTSVGGGTSADLAGDEQRRNRQEAATPKPPKPSREGQPASTVPPRSGASQSTKPPSRPDTTPPRPPSLGPPPTVQSDAPPSAFAGAADAVSRAMAGAVEPAIRQVESEPPPATASDVSTTPPPRRGRLEADEAIAPRDAEAPPAPEVPSIPEVLRAGSATRAVAAAVTARWTGGVAFEVDQGIRRVVFRDGDFVTAASGVHGESLVAFLVSRGNLPAEVAREAHKLPISGRHAGAALVARGHLTQDQLWDVLRAHAEWIIAQVSRIEAGSAALETDLPGRLKDEPAVFGGATGAEILVEIVRRTVEPEVAASRVGGWDTSFVPGPHAGLLGECALSADESELVATAKPIPLQRLVERAGDPSFAAAVYALSELGVVAVSVAAAEQPAAPDLERGIAEMDAGALRERILARRALVQEGDYFTLLGVDPAATAYDIRRAYLALRRDLDPSRALTPRTADLEDDLVEILDVIDEAYDILKDQVRRERYRRAIGTTP